LGNSNRTILLNLIEMLIVIRKSGDWGREGPVSAEEGIKCVIGNEILQNEITGTQTRFSTNVGGKLSFIPSVLFPGCLLYGQLYYLTKKASDDIPRWPNVAYSKLQKPTSLKLPKTLCRRRLHEG